MSKRLVYSSGTKREASFQKPMGNLGQSMSRPETLTGVGGGMTGSAKESTVNNSSGALLRVFHWNLHRQILELSVEGSPIQVGLLATHSTKDFK